MISSVLLTLAALQPGQSGGPSIEPSQLRIIDSNGQASESCPLKDTKVNASIEGFGARVVVLQTFSNPSSKPIEAIYTFPLPQDCAVDGMRMIIGDRVIAGIIKKREEARTIYEAAKKEGKSTALLDQERPNVFTQRVANIPPHAEIQVALTYVQLLKFENDQFEFVYPMVVAPRFTGATTPDPGKVTPPVVPEGTRSGSTISLNLQINAGAPITSISSVLHKIETTPGDNSRTKVKLARADEIPNRDFILRYSISTEKLVSSVLTYKDPSKGGFFTLILMPPKAVTPEQAAPKEAILVMDQSGSQKGFPIEKSKELTKKIIKALNPKDTFNVVSFSNSYRLLWPEARPNTSVNREIATKYVEALEANGGTQLEEAVKAALTLPGDPKRPRVVIFNTDGLLGGEAEALRQIQKHRGNARIFTFGIGNSVNRYLIEAMSTEGRGDHEIITLNADTDAATERLVQRTDAPVLTDVKVRFEGVTVDNILPRYIPDVFSEKPVIIKGRYSAPGKGIVVISGMYGGRNWESRFPITLPRNGSSGSAIGSLWAREKINDLELQERMETNWRDASRSDVKGPTYWETAITNLALDFSLMSRFTSFVAVDQRVINPGGKQETVQVPVEMADGMSYEKIFGSMAGKPNGRLAKAPRTPAYRAGDPLLEVVAPADCDKVVAIFPGGDLKPLAWNPATRKWEVRFDIPATFKEAVYSVRVFIIEADGTRRKLDVPFEVSNSTPALQPLITRLPDGNLWLHVDGNPRWARVLLLPPWGERLELVYDATRNEIGIAFKLPANFKGGWFKMIGFDRSFSQTSANIYINANGVLEKIEVE